jgi:hypothetical protein
LLVGACVAEAEDPESPDSAEMAEARALIMGERIGEAQEAAGTAAGEACRVYCATSYAAACLYVQHVCEGATVVTLGGYGRPLCHGHRRRLPVVRCAGHPLRGTVPAVSPRIRSLLVALVGGAAAGFWTLHEDTHGVVSFVCALAAGACFS